MSGKLPPGFAWIARGASDTLLENFQGEERRTALAIYTALALLSSQQHRGDHVGIEAARPTIAKRAGVQPKTLDRYLRRMEGVGLVIVERRRAGLRNLENRYTLLSDPAELVSLGPAESPGVATSRTPGIGTSEPQGGDISDPRLKEGKEGRPEQHQETAAAGSLSLTNDAADANGSVGASQPAADPFVRSDGPSAEKDDDQQHDSFSGEGTPPPAHLTGVWAAKERRYAAERAEAAA